MKKILLLISILLTASIDAGAQSSCKLPLQEPAPNFPKGAAGKKAFIDWITPAAKYVESKTGLPGAQIIAQAAIETGYGTSSLFRRGNSMFGHSCWNNSSQSGNTKMGDTSVPWKGSCALNRPAAEGGKYLKFDSHADSIAAYVQNLLEKGPYGELRKIVQASSPPERPADPRRTIAATAKAGYAADGSYAQKLNSIVRQESLQTPLQGENKVAGNDGNTCKAPEGNHPPQQYAQQEEPRQPAQRQPSSTGGTDGNGPSKGSISGSSGSSGGSGFPSFPMFPKTPRFAPPTPVNRGTPIAQILPDRKAPVPVKSKDKKNATLGGPATPKLVATEATSSMFSSGGRALTTARNTQRTAQGTTKKRASTTTRTATQVTSRISAPKYATSYASKYASTAAR